MKVLCAEDAKQGSDWPGGILQSQRRTFKGDQLPVSYPVTLTVPMCGLELSVAARRGVLSCGEHFKPT